MTHAKESGTEPLRANLATLPLVWGRLREFCRETSDIGDTPQAEYLPLAEDQLTEAPTAWAAGFAGPATRQALASPPLSYLLETVGVLAGVRLGLDGLRALTCGAWLTMGITGCEPPLEARETLAALDHIATQAVSELLRPMEHAYEDDAFWIRYRPAIPEVVNVLRSRPC